MKIFLFLTLFVFHCAQAQEFFSFLTPNTPQTSIEMEGGFSPQRDMDGGKDKTHVWSSAVGANQKIYDDGKNLVTLGGKWQKLDLTAQSKELNDFYNIQGSIGYRRMLENNNFAFGSLSYGSASDRPFKSNRDNTLNANYIQKFSPKWFGLLNYSNNRTFLNNIPLPGFFYVKEMTAERGMIIGFPIFYYMTPVGENYSLRYFGILPWTHRLKFLYTKYKFILPYIGYEQAPQTYFRDAREERKDRFFWFERRVGMGVEGGLARGFRFDFYTGWAFDRQFYEARNFSEKKKFLINLESAPFAQLNLRYAF
ncbi:hypothetical protein ACJVC5_14730 [Peredibacter sp. HCB2-198]|uniref:hypothetical protein n=1 Tax=Peredibacter sp. HCB2-198 TaxID=3383025 RepID=UPI0038B52C4F